MRTFLLTAAIIVLGTSAALADGVSITMAGGASHTGTGVTTSANCCSASGRSVSTSANKSSALTGVTVEFVGSVYYGELSPPVPQTGKVVCEKDVGKIFLTGTNKARGYRESFDIMNAIAVSKYPGETTLWIQTNSDEPSVPVAVPEDWVSLSKDEVIAGCLAMTDHN